MSEDEEESGIFTTPLEEQMYEPLPLVVGDGSVAIFDQVEFGITNNCLAARYEGGILSVLDRDSGLWRDIGKPFIKKVQ